MNEASKNVTSLANDDEPVIRVGDGREVRCAPGLTVRRLPAGPVTEDVTWTVWPLDYEQDGGSNGERVVAAGPAKTFDGALMPPTEAPGGARKRRVMPGEARRRGWR